MEMNKMKSLIGQKITEAEMVDMLKSQPICSTDTDVKIRSGVLSFSFGARGVTLTAVEERTPSATKEPK